MKVYSVGRNTHGSNNIFAIPKVCPNCLRGKAKKYIKRNETGVSFLENLF